MAYTKIFRDQIFNVLQSTRILKIPRWRSISAIGDEPGFEGDIILDRSTGLLNYHNGFTWIPVGPATGDNINLFNACPAGISLVVNGSGPNLSIAGLVPGTGISISGVSCVTISSTGENINLTDNCPNSGTTSRSIVLDGSGPDLLVRGLRSGTGIMLLNDSSCIIVCATSATDAIMIQDACSTGISLISNGSGPIFTLKNLLAGTGVSISTDGSCITISADGSDITLTTACSAPEISLVVDGSGPDLSIKGLLSGTGILLSDDGSCVTINTFGIATLNNACNDPMGVSLVVDGSGPDLAVAGLLAGSGASITSDGSCVTINFTDVITGISLSNACSDPSGVSLVVSGTPPGLLLAGLIAGTGVELVNDGSCITINNIESEGVQSSTFANISFTGLTIVQSLTIDPGDWMVSYSSGLLGAGSTGAACNIVGNLAVSGVAFFLLGSFIDACTVPDLSAPGTFITTGEMSGSVLVTATGIRTIDFRLSLGSSNTANNSTFGHRTLTAIRAQASSGAIVI